MKAQFDTTTTHMSYYDRFLNDKDLKYMQRAKNLTGEIVMMSPKEYYQYATEIFDYRHDVEDLIAQRSDSSLDEYVEAMKQGDVFPLCLLNFADKTQEGLHRMLAAARAFGWNEEYPVLIVKPYDEELWKEQAIYKEVMDFMNYRLRHMIDEAADRLADWDSPVPDDIAEQFKDTLEELARDDGDSIDVTCEVQTLTNEGGSSSRILTYLNRYNDITLDEPIQSTDYAWLDNMFDMDAEDDEVNVDDELMDLEDEEIFIEDQDIIDLFFK